MKEFGPIHGLWSEWEEGLADALAGVAGCVRRCCEATERRVCGLSEALLPVLHEYVLYGDTLAVRARRPRLALAGQAPEGRSRPARRPGPAGGLAPGRRQPPAAPTSRAAHTRREADKQRGAARRGAGRGAQPPRQGADGDWELFPQHFQVLL